ncbi:MAG: hypothetical protein JSC189_000197 [Candidatus Tokpelaia sp. JSC189]|nr:MAG: hypothetical protein JSC189_000197 [Candidatus Tokpelaia sp. JSC189]
MPSSAAHLLSNHYNETRNEYYRQLDTASRNGGDILPFINYAVQGFVDQIRNQIKHIRTEQLRIVWINYVHSRFKTLSSRKDRRRRDLLLHISEFGLLHKNIIGVMALKIYAGKTVTTLKRDIGYLRSEELIEETLTGYFPNLKALTAFLPVQRRVVE